MSAQKSDVQEGVKPDTPARTLYELLIYDNQKLSNKTEGPHIIMRRSLRGGENHDTKNYLAPDELGLQETKEAKPKELPQEPPVEDMDQEAVRSDSMVSSDTISSYIASLTHHVQSDVLRVVDAIIDLENDDQFSGRVLESNKEENPDTSLRGKKESLEESPSAYEEAERMMGSELPIDLDEQQQEVENTQEEYLNEEEKKRGLDLSEIFRSLKNARSKAEKKSYSYTKKVEYEDR